MSGYILKAAETDLDLPIDWRESGLATGERLVADLGWQVSPTGQDADLEIAEQFLAPAMSFALLSGGLSGKIYMVTASVRTDAGRKLFRSFVVRIEEAEPLAA